MSTDLVKVQAPQELPADLYERLGVSRDASHKVLKGAWREKAHLHHPDRGGDPKEFAKVKEAWDVLSDTASRQYYDDVGEAPPIMSESDIENAARSLATTIIDSVIMQETNPDGNDVLGTIMNSLQRQVQEFATRRATLNERRRVLDALLRRLTRKAKASSRPAILLLVLNARRKALKADEYSMIRDRKIYEVVVEIFREYQYEYDKPETSPFRGVVSWNLPVGF